MLLEGGLLLIDLCRPFSQLYFAESFDYEELDCSFELCLQWHGWKIFAGSHRIKLFAIIPLHGPVNLVQTPD